MAYNKKGVVIGKLMYKELEPVKNKRGEVKVKRYQIKNVAKRKGLTFETINKLYMELAEKYGAQGMVIRSKLMDNSYKTLKTADYTGTNLKHYGEEYFDNTPGVPTHVKVKLQGRYYSFELSYNV